jgi:hypothetical protein
MKKFLLSTVFFFLYFSLSILAQTTVTGTVTDASTQLPLPQRQQVQMIKVLIQ